KKIKFVIYDECLIDHTLPNERYLPAEAEVLWKIYDTILRRSDRITQLWLLGNPYSLINPYFSFFGINHKEVEKRINKFYKPYINRGIKLLVYYSEVHPDLLKEKEATTYGASAKQHKEYYEHTFKSKVKYRDMFAVKPFNEINNKSYLLKIKIVNKI